MLATLFKDERCQQLPAYSILEKMYLDRIIRRSELHEFEALMQTHQKVLFFTTIRRWKYIYFFCVLNIKPISLKNPEYNTYKGLF